jgi:hypothetical protein
VSFCIRTTIEQPALVVRILSRLVRSTSDDGAGEHFCISEKRSVMSVSERRSLEPSERQREEIAGAVLFLARARPPTSYR